MDAAEVRIPRAVLAAMEAHAREARREECCGFLIGTREGAVRSVVEARRGANVEPASRATRYRLDPGEVLAVERECRGATTRLVGFYHSHVSGPPRPSAYDEERAWPWYAYVIVAASDPDSPPTAWVLDEAGRTFHEVPVRLL